MRTTTRFVSGKQFITEVGPFQIVTDQRPEQGGTGAGPSPPELLAASLGACAAHYAKEFLQARSLSVEGLTVTVESHHDETKRGRECFHILVESAPIDEQYNGAFRRAVESCKVHHIIRATPEITIDFTSPGHELTVRGCTSLTET